MNMDQVIELMDECGNPCKFDFLDVVTFDGCDYVVLMPEGSTSNEVVILRAIATEEENQELYATVDDDEKLEKVFQAFIQQFKEGIRLM